MLAAVVFCYFAIVCARSRSAVLMLTTRAAILPSSSPGSDRDGDGLAFEIVGGVGVICEADQEAPNQRL